MAAINFASDPRILGSVLIVVPSSLALLTVLGRVLGRRWGPGGARGGDGDGA